MNDETMTADEWNELNAILASQGARTYPPMMRCEYCGEDTDRNHLYWVRTRHIRPPYHRTEKWCKGCATRGQEPNTEEAEARYPKGYRLADKLTLREMIGLDED